MSVSNNENLDFNGMLTLNTSGLIIDVNEQYLVKTGLKKQALLGQSIETFDTHSAKKIFAEKPNLLFSHYQSTLIIKDGTEEAVDVCLYTQHINNNKFIILFITSLKNTDDSNSTLYVMEQIFNNSDQAITVTNNQGYILSVNKSFTTITGYSSDEVIGKTPAILSSGKQDKLFYDDFWTKLKSEGYWQGEIWNKRKNGEIYPEWLYISNIRGANNNITHYIAQFTDITQRKKSEEELHFRVYHDSLTNLPNRRLLFEKLDHLSLIKNQRPTEFALLFCDLDRFKLINDSLGHEVGDEVLKCVAERFVGKLRGNDIIARSGGDEFIVVIEGDKALRNLDKICLQILSLFEQPFQTKFGDFKISISIGVSQFPTDSLDIRELITFADVAMLKVKESGGNSYELFDTREKTLITQRLELEKEIYQAIENNHFEVWYQPQINAINHEVYGIECLLRWNHPSQGLISPNLFIPLAEANASIKELGHFVLKTACKQLRQWRINNLFTGVMAINVSLRQFDRNDIIAQVRNALTDEMIPGNAIELEVTESLFSEYNDHFIPILSALRDLGVKIAIDDFGTGYSSLQRLKNLPIDNVKIDKCFIDNIESSQEDQAIVKALILLSKTFKIDLVAEGIETQEQALILNSLGCSNHQGFLYSKPLRASEFEPWLINFKNRHKKSTSIEQTKDYG